VMKPWRPRRLPRRRPPIVRQTRGRD